MASFEVASDDELDEESGDEADVQLGFCEAPHHSDPLLFDDRDWHNWDGGIAFVRFANPDDADAALEALDGTPSLVTGCNMYVDFAYEERRGGRPLVDLKGEARPNA